MAKGDVEKKPTVADKGKEKAPQTDEANGADKKAEPRRDKDGNIIKDGHDRGEEELSEEDQAMKNELDMLVQRLQESDASLYKPAVDAIGNFIKTSTSSMTAVPKPLKFLRPHYDALEKAYEQWSSSDSEVSAGDAQALADVLSVLGMTQSDEGRLDSLKYRLLAPSKDIGKDNVASWGHEYMRHLALELGEQYQKDVTEDVTEKDEGGLTALAKELVPYFLEHNAEADAVDLMSELEIIDEIASYVDENNYERVCAYMVSMVPLLTFPFNDELLRAAHDIYKKYGRLNLAMNMAIRLNDLDLIKQDLNSTEDQSLRRQMAYQISRQRISLDLSDNDDEQFAESLNNTRLHQHFKSLGKELNILDPKSPQDIYKSHLESSRTAGMTNVDSARHNLASAFVNAFVNAGFGSDKLMLSEDESQRGSWVWKTKDDGKISTAASVGMLQQWDLDDGLQTTNTFQESNDDLVKAGGMLSVGVLNSGVREPSEPAMALLATEEVLNHKNKDVRVCAIMGLGLAYAGTQNEDVVQVLLPYVSDSSLEMQLSAMAALSLGLICVGSTNSDVSEAIVTTFFDDERQSQLKDKWTRFMALGLALLYFGRQEEVDVILETLEAVDHPMSKPSSVLCQICAWAGTGTVLKIQELLHICNEHIESDSDKDKDADPSSPGTTNNKDGQNSEKKSMDPLLQSYAVLGLGLVAMGEEVGQDMILRQFGHLMHYGEPNIRRAVPLAMGLVSPSNPQMKVYDTLSRYTHDNDNDVAVNAIFAMGLLGAGTNNARLAQLLRQLASYYSREPNSLFMVRIAQGLLHMGKGTLSVNPFHTDRTTMSRVAAAGLLTVLVSLIDAKSFILDTDHYLLYFLAPAMNPRFLVTLDEELNPLKVNVRVGQAVDTVGQAGRPKTITGWQTQSTPVVLGYGERAELEDEKFVPLNTMLEGVVILRKNPDWED